LQSAAQAELQSVQAEADKQQQQQGQSRSVVQSEAAAAVGSKRPYSDTAAEPASKKQRTVVVLLSDGEEEDEDANQQQQQQEIEGDSSCQLNAAAVQRKLSKAMATVAAAEDKLRAFDTKQQQQQVSALQHGCRCKMGVWCCRGDLASLANHSAALSASVELHCCAATATGPR
jgi:hypothetical protein